MSDEIPALEGESAAPVAEAPAAEAAAQAEPQRRKRGPPLHWKRPKSHVYEYNFDYGGNYYKHMVDYLDNRSSGLNPEPPKALNWAERALRTYAEKREAATRSNTNPDVELLHKVRSSIHTYTVHAKQYARKYTSTAY